MPPDFFDDVAPKIEEKREYILIDRSKEIAKLAKPIITHKKCGKCEQEKEVKYFSKINNKYYASYCYECVRKVAKAEYIGNKKDRIKRITKWRKKNKAKVKGYNKVYQEKRSKVKKRLAARIYHLLPM